MGQAGRTCKLSQRPVAFIDEIRQCIKAPVVLTEVDAHINDQAFSDAALAVLDSWIADGTVDVSVTDRE